MRSGSIGSNSDLMIVHKPESVHEDTTDYSVKAQTKTKFSDFLRIFTYSTASDRVFLGIAFLGQIGTGAVCLLFIE